MMRRQRSVAELVSSGKTQYGELVEELAAIYRKHWAPETSRPKPPAVPGHLARRDLDAGSALCATRRFVVVNRAWPRVWGLAENEPRFEDPLTHPWTAAIVRDGALVNTIESLIALLGQRLLPWFGALPDEIDWAVIAAPKTFQELGYWHSVIGSSLDEELESFGLDLTRDARIPKFWSETAAHLIKWNIAVELRMRVPTTYSPPSAVRNCRFGELGDPFTPLLDIWRCGVMIEGSFMSGRPRLAVVYVNGRSLDA